MRNALARRPIVVADVALVTASLVFVAAAMAAGPMFTSTWISPSAKGVTFTGKKVVALIISSDENLRVSGEEQLARELTALGMQGMPAYRMIPREELTSAERARPWFERAGIDGVVSLRPVSMDTRRDEGPTVWTQPNYSTLWGYYGYGWTTVYVFGGAREDTKLVVETLGAQRPEGRVVVGRRQHDDQPQGRAEIHHRTGRRNREGNEERAPRKMTTRVLAFTCAALIAGAGNPPGAAGRSSAGRPRPAGVDPVTARHDAGVRSTWLTATNPRNGPIVPADQQTFDWAAQGRACEGCPPRSVGRAVFQSTMINVFYGLANLLRGHDTAKVTPEAWWNNMKQGWVWDLNDFPVNQVGHPYQGNNYFTAGRANGLSFYESSAVAAFGSATWEYFGETNSASLNDFINTTLGGIALGEMFHRTAWLVRDTRATGRGRMWREIAATAFDPVGGYNNFTRGDGGRVYDKPADMVPSGLGAVASLGALWRGQENGSVSGAEGQAFLEVDLLYGDTRSGQHPNAVRRLRGAAAFRRRQLLQRGTRPRPAARRTVVEREAALLGHPDLRLSEQRCVRHRLAVVRRGAGVHAAAVVSASASGSSDGAA